ncbi:MAG TPA: DUF4442 domain-containing protein [Fluviicoccus sp.]|nr:DUF4442 domain-containing protein [Fluviicoccus sp.]
MLERLPRNWLLRLRLNAYLPYLGAGVRIERISPDFLAIDVRMKLHSGNANYVGTHFGGSLYSMTDPHFMLMVMENLGKDYIVWDKAARIDFVAPGRGTVHARFRLDAAEIERLRTLAADGQPVLPEYAVEVTDEEGKLVARVHKTLYVRRKKRARPVAQAS